MSDEPMGIKRRILLGVLFIPFFFIFLYGSLILKFIASFCYENQINMDILIFVIRNESLLSFLGGIGILFLVVFLFASYYCKLYRQFLVWLILLLIFFAGCFSMCEIPKDDGLKGEELISSIMEKSEKEGCSLRTKSLFIPKE